MRNRATTPAFRPLVQALLLLIAVAAIVPGFVSIMSELVSPRLLRWLTTPVRFLQWLEDCLPDPEAR